jgi:hypothetical protein
MIRRRFTMGSMAIYCCGTPVKWFFLLLCVYCGGGERLGA